MSRLSLFTTLPDLQSISFTKLLTMLKEPNFQVLNNSDHCSRKHSHFFGSIISMLVGF